MFSVLALQLLLAQAPALVPGWNVLPLRGLPQDVIYLPPAQTGAVSAPVLFLPGDGGWRGFAVELANRLAAQGHPVYGLDTKKYLTSFTAAGKHLTTRAITHDMHDLAARVAPGSRVLVVGWSQGAAMAVLAAHGRRGHRELLGAVLLSPPREAALGWRWRDTLLSLFRKRPGEPRFVVADQMAGAAPVPLVLIHPAQDSFTTREEAEALFRAARAPKQLRIVCGAGHSFDEARPVLWPLLADALAWAARPHTETEPPVTESAGACPGAALTYR